MKVLLYATKAKPYLFNETRSPYPNYQLEDDKYLDDVFELLNGKVCAMFEWGGYEKLLYGDLYNTEYYYAEKAFLSVLSITEKLLKKACLTQDEIVAYGKGKPLYAWHIDNFQMLDEPIELGELYSDWDIFDTDSNGKYVGDYVQVISTVKKAPQSYQYVYYKGEKCLLLSIKSEWLYKILNGEKTVEIRKSVPKELREDE